LFGERSDLTVYVPLQNHARFDQVFVLLKGKYSAQCVVAPQQ